MKIDLSPNQVEQIEAFNKQYREAKESGDIITAEKSLLSAWAVLPNIVDYEFYPQSLSRGLVQFYRDTNQSQKAVNWLENARVAYGPETDASIEFLAGTVYFTARELDTAFLLFDKLYKQYKERPFKGEKPEYLEFYKTELEKRK